MQWFEQFRKIRWRLRRNDDDIRHTLLDVLPECQTLLADQNRFPPYLHDEIKELSAELAEVEPRFASHRNSSILFDRAGLGRPGLERAAKLARRILALVKQIESELDEAD